MDASNHLRGVEPAPPANAGWGQLPGPGDYTGQLPAYDTPLDAPDSLAQATAVYPPPAAGIVPPGAAFSRGAAGMPGTWAPACGRQGLEPPQLPAWTGAGGHWLDANGVPTAGPYVGVPVPCAGEQPLLSSHYGTYDLAYANRQVRHGFIVKVLGLLSAQLTATAAIGAVLILAPSARMWLALNPLALFIAAVAAATCLIALACSEAARRQYPTNMILLSAFTLTEGLLVGTAAAAYSAPSIVLAVVLTAVVVFALTAYALQTRVDFTASGGMLYSALCVLLATSMLATVMPGISTLDALSSGCGALLMCCYLVYDIQLLASGDHRYTLGADDYIFATLNLYTDIINLGLYILQLLGQYSDED